MRQTLERETMPRFLQRQRWYASKTVSPERAQIVERAEEAGRELTGSRRTSKSGPSSEATLRTKLGALERRMRQIEDDLADRARRDGALPGWLR